MKNDIQSHRGTLTNLNNGLKSESWSIWIFTGDNERDGNNGQKGGGLKSLLQAVIRKVFFLENLRGVGMLFIINWLLINLPRLGYILGYQ